jgi:hypothetical protein
MTVPSPFQGEVAEFALPLGTPHPRLGFSNPNSANRA